MALQRSIQTEASTQARGKEVAGTPSVASEDLVEHRAVAASKGAFKTSTLKIYLELLLAGGEEEVAADRTRSRKRSWSART